MTARPAAGKGALAKAWLALAFLASLLILSHASAQAFDENVYYQQCLRFEAGGDLETARRACQNALQVRPSFAEAELALARIELRLGEHGSAENRLRRVRNVIPTAEPLVLLAEAALAGGRPDEAAGYLSSARTILQQQGNRELEGHLQRLAGSIDEFAGRYDAALAAYGAAIAADPLNVGYRLAEARLRLRLGEPAAAAAQLASYVELTGDDRDPDVRSLLGRALWAQGDLNGAAGHLEFAHQLRGARDVDAQAEDLRALALIYFAEGDFDAGNVALRESLRRDNLLSRLGGNTLVWLFTLLLLVAVHLVAESRIPSTTGLEVVDGPQPWSVGNVYGTLVVSLVLGLAAAVAYGEFVHGNPLAIVTPVQATDAWALFFITLSVFLVLLSWRRASITGHDPMESLVGSSRQPLNGVGLGLLFLAALLAYLHFDPFEGALGGFYLDLVQLTPYVVAAMILVPLAEVFFRGFAFPSLARRYDKRSATVVSAVLYALTFGTPVALLLVFGLVLADGFRRRPNSTEPLIAQLTLHVGLLVAVSVSPWARSLFFG
ncbi:MAG TPA: tetratricopeptide repeat protein [Trueperaceae bacterium]|nr:tetratricopeptide repeat protein [Trueperaceae bacterium]